MMPDSITMSSSNSFGATQQKESPIDLALSDLEKQVVTLKQLAPELERRLKVVSRQTIQKPPSDKIVSPGSGIPLVDRINDSTALLSELNFRINDLLGNLGT